METVLIKALQLMLSLTILVFVHELGHYFFARIFGTKVDQFYLFFNPWFKIFKYNPKGSKKWSFFGRNNTPEEDEAAQKKFEESGAKKATWRDTEYGLGWLPLGGYCAINGMIDENVNTNNLDKPAQPWEFRSKKWFPRFMIMVGGVLFNFILATVIYAGIVWAWGEKFIRFEDASAGMLFSQSAHNIGFQDGDIILSADGKHLDYLSAESLQAILTAKTVEVKRGGEVVTVNVPDNFIFEANKDAEQGMMPIDYRLPVMVGQTQPGTGAEKEGLMPGDRILSVHGVPVLGFDTFSPILKGHAGKVADIMVLRDGKEMAFDVEIDQYGKIGIALAPITEVYQTITLNYNIFESVPRGIEMGWDKLASYVKSMSLVFSAEGAQSLGGFGAMASSFPDTWNWYGFWNITAFISVILAFMNIIPIPGLDGGHILFLLYELVVRRKPSVNFLIRAQYFGMAILLALLLFANGNDIYRFFFK